MHEALLWCWYNNIIIIIVDGDSDIEFSENKINMWQSKQNILSRDWEAMAASLHRDTDPY